MKPSCPRCDQPLEETTAFGAPFHVCSTCGALWAEGTVHVATILRMRPEVVAEDIAAALHCPECRLATRAVTVFGTRVQLCDSHGVWLDLTILDGADLLLALADETRPTER